MNTKKILVVDDREVGHIVLKELIENPQQGVSKWAPCTLLKAYSGNEALKIIKNTTPNLILMDINMPEIDGLETTRRIRKNDKKTPIIAVTAQAMEGDREKCLEAGCTYYISKPYDIKEMIKLMLQYIGVTINEKHRVH